MVVPFFEDELLLMFDCAKDYSYDGIVEGLYERIDKDFADDLTSVNMCFRILGKLPCIPDEDFWRIFDDIDFANYCRKHPEEEQDDSKYCHWGSDECKTCENKEECAEDAIDYGPDANLHQASVIFC